MSLLSIVYGSLRMFSVCPAFFPHRSHITRPVARAASIYTQAILAPASGRRERPEQPLAQRSHLLWARLVLHPCSAPESPRSAPSGSLSRSLEREKVSRKRLGHLPSYEWNSILSMPASRSVSAAPLPTSYLHHREGLSAARLSVGCGEQGLSAYLMVWSALPWAQKAGRVLARSCMSWWRVARRGAMPGQRVGGSVPEIGGGTCRARAITLNAQEEIAPTFVIFHCSGR